MVTSTMVTPSYSEWLVFYTNSEVHVDSRAHCNSPIMITWILTLTEADVVWTAPDGMTISDNARYDLENRPDIVRLNFTHTVKSDTGVWRCDVRKVHC